MECTPVRIAGFALGCLLYVTVASLYMNDSRDATPSVAAPDHDALLTFVGSV
jgi:hypothetical protein